MKRMINFIIVIFLLTFSNYTKAQPTGIAYIENAQVNGLVFSWELHFERTNGWTPGLLTNAMGISSASFNVDTSGLGSPSLVVEPGGPLDNANYPSVTAQLINDKCIVDIQFALNALAGQLPLNVKTKLLTVSMNIKNTSLTAGLSWDALNTGFFDNTDETVVTTLEGSSDIPLPVELTSFTSKYLNDKIQLNWVTKTEVNNYGFNVERRINDSEWNSIGFVAGHGNSNSPKEYSYSDKDLFAGGSLFQYRLKQVDTDGTFEYSDVVEVDVMPTQFELSQNYPNPFNPSTTIRFSLPHASQIKIELFNIIGEQVATLADGMYESGFHKIEFSAKGGSASGGNAYDLPSGAYIYRLTSESFVQTKKMLLLK